MRRPPALLACLLGLTLVGVACSGDDGGEASDPGVLDQVTVSGEFGEAPTIDFDAPLETDETVRQVLIEGDGDPTEAGMNITFEHVAVNGRDGSEFDSSYEQGPAAAVLDDSQVIPGLVSGLVDVRIGSRVLVAMAPDDAFGPRGGIEEEGVAADDTVLFVIDLQDATFPLDRAEGTPVDPEPGLPTVTLADDGAPTVRLPDGEPPDELVTQPLIRGDGPEVEAGQTITAHYTGIIWPGGDQFDSSWDRDEPAQFQIGVGAVIPGWDEGLVGQPVGSQVLLVIPPDQGYGDQGNPQAGIEGTDTLVFVVDILAAS